MMIAEAGGLEQYIRVILTLVLTVSAWQISQSSVYRRLQYVNTKK